MKKIIVTILCFSTILSCFAQSIDSKELEEIRSSYQKDASTKAIRTPSRIAKVFAI